MSSATARSRRRRPGVILAIGWATVAAIGPSDAGAVTLPWDAGLRVDAAHSSNHTASSIEDPGLTQVVGGNLDLHPVSSMTLGAESSAFLRADVEDRNAFLHTLGASWGTPTRGRETFGGAAVVTEWLRHDADFESYDRRVVEAEGNAGWRPAATAVLSLRAGYTATRWANQSEMDADDLWGSVRANVSLPSRTSVTLSVGLENRRYLEEDAAALLVSAHSPAVMLGRNQWGSGGGGGGNGTGTGDDGGAGSDGGVENGDAGDGGTESASSGSVLTTRGGTSDALLRSIRLHVAQNVAAKVGVTVTGEWRGAGDYLNRYYESEGQPQLLEAAAYDERFAYRQAAAKAGLNVRLSSSRRLELATRYETRDFVGRPALDLAGDPVGGDREDRRFDSWATFRLAFAVLPVTAELTVRHVRNESNDLLYDYDQFLVYAGTRWRLH